MSKHERVKRQHKAKDRNVKLDTSNIYENWKSSSRNPLKESINPSKKKTHGPVYNIHELKPAQKRR